MSEEELNEAIEYNLEYMEAMQSEEIFGGDYTSQVELKYANKSIDKLEHQKQELINWLESKNNITLQQHKTIEPVIKVQEVIDKIKESE